jgi:hypothetical protein
MSGGKRAEDKLNTIGIVVVGVCGAVLVYVTIVALEAFYVNDTSELQTMADYGGTDTTAKSLKAAQLGNLAEYGTNAAVPGKDQTYHLKIDRAMALVADAAKNHQLLVPALGPLTRPEDCKTGMMGCPTALPIFGRPRPLVAPAPATPPAGAGSAAPAGAGSDAGSAAGSGSATPTATNATTPNDVTPVPVHPAAAGGSNGP